MSTITHELDAILNKFQANAPDVVKTPITTAIASLQNYDTSNIIQPGRKLPSFTLPSAVGDKVSSASLLSNGPLVIVFYRGEWCPFCNIAMAGFQQHLPEFKAKGVTLVGITPEMPNGTLTMMEKHALEFSVLTDEHNDYARKLGIVWKQPDYLRPAFATFGNDLAKKNGDDSFELPIPTTLLVDRLGVVRRVDAKPDYTERTEPETVLGWIGELGD